MIPETNERSDVVNNIELQWLVMSIYGIMVYIKE